MPLRAGAQTAPKPTSPTGNSIGEAADFDARAQQLHNSFAAQRTLASRRSCSALGPSLICCATRPTQERRRRPRRRCRVRQAVNGCR